MVISFFFFNWMSLKGFQTNAQMESIWWYSKSSLVINKLLSPNPLSCFLGLLKTGKLPLRPLS